MAAITGEWQKVLEPEFAKPYYRQLYNFVREEYSKRVIFPPSDDIFNALAYTPLERVKCVILGQDPYHEVHQAHGLCFSVLPGNPPPPSLVNIYKEIHRDLGTPIPVSGDLRRWAEQGVLLLNATLTVEAHKAGSHQGKGWEELTDAAIAALNKEREHIVFMLWGSYAQRKGQFIDRRKHLVLQTSHPSPLSVYRGFDGCGHFSAANNYLIKNGLEPIQW